MPTHEEHFAGIEEATDRVRTLKVKFNNAEDDWCEAGKQLQRVHDIRQKWIDQYGFAPSDPLMQPLLQPSQRFYYRKAREYLVISREMTNAITQRDLRVWRYLDFLNRESSTEEKDEPGARAERERAAYRERMRQQRSARAEAEERQRREEEAQRQRQEEEAQRQRQEEAQRQAQARAEARARERRDAEQRQERARQEHIWRQAKARQEEQTRRQREQAQQDSRKRQREQAEQEAQRQQETRKRQKTQPHSQPAEHNTTAPTKPYGNLTTAQATLEWRTRFLQTWPAPFYRTLQAFPAPPPIPCAVPPCCARPGGTERVLKVCEKFLRETFKTLSKDELRIQRIKWHPDRFSACPGPHVEAYKKMAGEVFVVVNEVYEKKTTGGSCG